MTWYLDVSLLIAAISWASSNHQTSTALTTFIVVYLISSSMAVVTPPNGTQTSPSSSDENPFMMDDCKAPDWFECHNKRCIVASWKCDDENDCMDWSDEDYFLCKANGTSLEPFVKTRCGDNEFHCNQGDSCIPSRWVCDRQDDCPNGEDEAEAECQGTQKSCSDSQFTCTSGECIPTSWKCDGNFDCEDRSDEATALCEMQQSRGECVTACAEGWETHGNHCFKWKTHSETWNTAETCCKIENAHLASITSDSISKYVEEGIRSRNLTGVWIGANDKDKEGTWKWTDGSPFEYTNWYPGQPNSYYGDGEDCAQQLFGFWADVPCTDWSKGLLCGKKICSSE